MSSDLNEKSIGSDVMCLKECICVGVVWIHVAQGRNQWRTLVDTGMKPSRYINYGNFLNHLSDY
jgi:hypothetical protein